MRDLAGKNRDQIERALVGKTRAELVDIIVSMAAVEQHFKPAEIAARSAMKKRTILADIHAGKFNGEYFKRSENQITVSASGVNAWRRSFRVAVQPCENEDLPHSQPSERLG
jgi:hypothetical protein